MWMNRKRKRYQNELKGEFRLHRCLFHHYDVIDFTVFEFGMRVTYLVWRVLCLILVPLLTLSLYEDILRYKEREATPYSSFIYIHMWLAILLTVSLIIEVAALCWSFILYPTCELVCMQHVPWYFKLMWYMYNTIYCNIAACGVMYTSFLSMREVLGLQYYLFLVLVIYTGVHVSSTAMPSRIAHALQPLSLTVFHIFFTAIYQSSGGTDPRGNKYVYSKMDWIYKLQSIMVALVWMLIVLFIHVSLVFASWGRRLMYRRLRKGKEAIVNPDPDDDSSLCSDDVYDDYVQDQPSPRIWIEDIPGDPTGHKRVILESPPPKRSCPSVQNKYLYEVWRDPNLPHYPGEKRKRLLLEQQQRTGYIGEQNNQRYLFAHGNPCGSPPRTSYSYQRGHHVQAYPQEVSYICHPDMSPDGESIVYKCMPESPRHPPSCYACEDDRYVDRQRYINKIMNLNTPVQDPPQPIPHAYRFRVGQGPIVTKPFVCPRDMYGDIRFPVKDKSLQTVEVPDNEVKPSLNQSGSRETNTPRGSRGGDTLSSKPSTAPLLKKSSSKSQPPRYSEISEEQEKSKADVTDRNSKTVTEKPETKDTDAD